MSVEQLQVLETASFKSVTCFSKKLSLCVGTRLAWLHSSSIGGDTQLDYTVVEPGFHYGFLPAWAPWRPTAA